MPMINFSMRTDSLFFNAKEKAENKQFDELTEEQQALLAYTCLLYTSMTGINDDYKILSLCRQAETGEDQPQATQQEYYFKSIGFHINQRCV